ncbi:AAA family ATPase [Oceanobacillus jordanicus]|uniref:Nuclease SbcCD subunit C n=1 Tax=Oceanobacillus jordanicus TaxID=2867266 RepID=A0AAW5B7G2_9BACI|nr:AAA family ATPase [Oceanobacillus jordanicus]MCG3419459.1 AAA family ATPase [Oceanobacillus jordanicus]
MKPLKLTLTAFGPYKEKEVINFTDLQENRLFVISGNTGAGKTTIFDGICFALYGSASGQDRENNAMLRSDFADDNVHTAVELEFALNERTYRVLRQLGHIKSGNKTKTGERYEFFEITNGNEIPVVDRQMVSEIDRKIEELIGLTQDQFKQIVMLPQGEFRKLLTSQTENKEEILRRLFKTEPYKHITEKIKQKRLAMDDAYKQAVRVRDQYIAAIGKSLPKRDSSTLFPLLEAEYQNTKQVLDGLEGERQYYEAKIVEDKAAYEHAYKSHNQKQTTYHLSKALNDRFAALEQKENRLKELVDQAAQFEKKEVQLEKAERAQRLAPYEKQREEWRRDEAAKQAARKEAEQNKIQIDEKRVEVQAAYEKEENKKAEREAIRKELDKLHDFLPVVKEMDTAKQKLQRLHQQGKATYAEWQQAKEKLEEQKNKAEQLDQKIKTLDQLVEKLPDKQQQLGEMREQIKLVLDYLKRRDHLRTLETEIKQQKQVVEEKRKHYLKLEENWISNQATLLAEHLHDGEACPVCGSVEHPEKATSRSDAISKEQLEKAKHDYDADDSKYREVSANYQAAKTQVEEKVQELNSYSVSLENAEQTKDKLTESGTALKQEVEQLNKARKELADQKQSYEQVKVTTKQLEEKVQAKEKAYQEIKSSYDTSKAVYQERVNNIPEDVRVLTELEQKIQQAKKQQEMLENAWETIQKRLQEVKEMQAKAVERLTHVQQQCVETTTKREEVEKQFTTALAEASFSAETDYQDAKLSEEAFHELKNSVEQFKQTLSTVREQVSELRTELKDKEKADLSAIESELAKLKETYEVTLKTWQESKNYHQEAKDLYQSIAKASEESGDIERKLRTISDLYDAIRGQNNRKISFERYLQIEYLEQIIDAANQRLKHLSNGQFFLMRSDRQESHGRQSGLALDVYDAYTGQTRDVKTLSGGEKFNASLCLALGMSDVIQSFQGNISIKTMFIDEGFGTLDEEALNKAIDTLVDLQQSGRMIGVISHVQELKTIFPAVLEVKKTKEGSSRAKFLIK